VRELNAAQRRRLADALTAAPISAPQLGTQATRELCSTGCLTPIHPDYAPQRGWLAWLDRYHAEEERLIPRRWNVSAGRLLVNTVFEAGLAELLDESEISWLAAQRVAGWAQWSGCASRTPSMQTALAFRNRRDCNSCSLIMIGQRSDRDRASCQIGVVPIWPSQRLSATTTIRDDSTSFWVGYETYSKRSDSAGLMASDCT